MLTFLLLAFVGFLLLFAALGLTLFLVDRAIDTADKLRSLVHQTALDSVQVYNSAGQARIDLDTQRAKLEAWQEYATDRLINHRQRLKKGGGQ